ncbi:c-type cytochrome [Flavobacterium sp. NG2]|uniref:c-type cytochrome n=1 Tax=Flavobacterium sp. NG2 TaxID=3097547 RepID=UPI002A83B916|nr:c-type cytochrome [Flavobacterium sp. NG2]WPR71047.1 c-type cytochrome [Flavobacterium sp. NG2]
MKKYHLIAITIYTFLNLSCSNNSESDLTTEPNPTPTPTTITYTNTINAIISTNCISCHGVPTTNGASISLNTYTKVKNAVSNDQLIERISKAQGESGLMPYNGTRLPQATIDKVVSWKNDGFKE